MQELNQREVEQVAGGLAIYYTPPPPYNSNPYLLDESYAGARTPGEYIDPNPVDWNV